MFKEAYREKFDAIHPDPALRQAIAERMNEMQYGNDRRYVRRGVSRRMISVLAALLVLMLTATAVAVVQGRMLRSQMEEQGDETIAAQVQDVHVSDAEDGFGFTIDEVVWEDDGIYLSYTITVPDDGNAYLYGLHVPEINGEALKPGSDSYLASYSNLNAVHAAGGDYPCKATDVLRLAADPAQKDRADNRLSMRVGFFRAESEIVQLTDYDAFLTVVTYEPDDINHNMPIIEGVDKLYSHYAVGNGTPLIDLSYYRAVKELQQSRINVLNARDDLSGADRLRLLGTAMQLSEDDLVNLGIAKEIAAERELIIPLNLSGMQETVYNDVAQRLYEMDGYTIEITEFRLSHFGAKFRALIRKDGEINFTEYDGDYDNAHPVDGLINEPLARSYALCAPNGTELGSDKFYWGGANPVIDENGKVIAIEIDGDITGIISLDGLDEVLLVPQKRIVNGDTEEYVNVMDEAIALKPVFDPAKEEAETEEESESGDSELSLAFEYTDSRL